VQAEFRVEQWLVRPGLNLVSQNGTAVHLEPKVMQVLVCLAQHAGEPVNREELIQTVWPGTFVTDDALKRCISELRRVFEDDAREPRIIETISKRGYRLVASVGEIQNGNLIQPIAVHALSAPQAAQSPILRQQALKLSVVIIACLLVAALITVAYVRGKGSGTFAPPVFHRLTYERGIIYSARFAPDNQVVYDASWRNGPIRLFTTHPGLQQQTQLDFSAAHLLGISEAGELALSLKGYPEAYPLFLKGTLARAPISGGAPRQLLPDVRWADWDRNGELAIVRHVNGKSRLEYPPGNVLYENEGWISHIRFSPRDNAIAFVDHPTWSEDRGSIVVLDLKTRRNKTLSGEWEAAQGLAWSAKGKEIWFTVARAGERRTLYAVDLDGHERMLLQVPGGITLQDISPDGRVLLTVDNERLGTLARSPAGERDLSWLDDNFPLSISPDGKQVLISDQSEQAGPDYLIRLQNIDSSAPIRLGEGWGGNFSPDGKWTVTAQSSTPESIFLVPLGPGDRKELKHPGVRTYGYTSWFMPDGKNVLLIGIGQGHLPRTYLQSIQGGPAKPVTPEGMISGFPSPDGHYVVASQLTASLSEPAVGIFDVERGEFHPIPGANENHVWPTGWSSDSRYIYLYTRGIAPAQVLRFDINRGREEVVRFLSPADPTGILEIYPVLMTPDAKTFVYGYDRYLSELYIVDGLN
jgi:eukaryotic-like serine/threonine-protein kinase